ARRLHFLACVKCDEANELKAPDKRSLLAQAWPLAQEIFAGLDPVPGAPPAASTERTYKLRRLASGFKLPSAPDAVRWNAPDETREQQQIEFSWVGETARHMGTVVHRWLQRMAEDELEGWDDVRITAYRAVVRSQLFTRGVSANEL